MSGANISVEQMSDFLDYDNKNWSKDFAYDPESPSGLVWVSTRYSFNGQKKETWPGKPAGSLVFVKNGDNKAWTINFEGKNYKVHRIVAVLNGLKVNGKVIDHIDGNSSNNIASNLRAVTITANSRNTKAQHNSRYGISGVGFQQDRAGNAYFVARVKMGGRTVQKSFPIKFMGLMPAFTQACVARTQMIAAINESSPGEEYTPRHTKVDNVVLGVELKEANSELRAKSYVGCMRSSNSSGVVGVSIGTDRGETYIVASGQLQEKKFRKKFSVRKMGLMPAFKAAVEHRRKMIEELNAQGAGYTENHGK